MLQKPPLKIADISTAKECDILLEYALKSRVSDVQEAIKMALETVKVAKKIAYKNGVATAQSHLGLFYMIVGSNEKALEYSEMALAYFKKVNDKSGMASVFYTIGSIRYKTSKPDIGLAFLYKCVNLQEEMKDLAGQSKTMKAIGYIYETFGESEKAFEVYLKCRKISKSIGDKNGESNACNPLSHLYLKKGDFKNALEVVETSIRLKEETGDKRGIAFAFYGKAKIHLELSEYKEAEKLFFKCLEIHNKVGEKLGAGVAFIKLGILYYRINDFNSAEKHFKEALKVGKIADNKEILFKAYHNLFLMEQENKNYQKALEYHIKFHQNREFVINTESKARMSSLEAVWQVEIAKRETKILQEKNKQINKTNKLIKRKNEELDTFVYRVSHDLRGPISSLLGLHTIVKLDVKDTTALTYFDLYKEQITRLNSIILDLIELTRVRGWELKKTNIDFEKMVSECMSSFKYFPTYNKIDFQLEIQKDLQLLSDKSLMNTIIQNLLENAIKYSDTEKEAPYVAVVIQENRITKAISISVRDNGIGIDKEHQKKIFDMFFRVSNKVQGSGLGMYILKNAIDKLDGKIKLTSQPRVGSEFEVLIPIQPQKKQLNKTL